MKRSNKHLFPVTAALLLIFTSGTSNAQKLPNEQTSAKLIPASVKIDGKLLEWRDSLAARNRANRLEYVLASDENHIYFAFRSKDKAITAKIIAGGISLVISAVGKKKLKDLPAVTFPFTLSGYEKRNGGMSSNYSILTDSISIRKAIVYLKEIKVARLSGVTDSLLSIYNQEGIKTKLTFNNNSLVGELILPIRLLAILTPESQGFDYCIRLNGVPYPPQSTGSLSPPPPGAPAGKDPAPYLLADEVRTPTEFWGTYSFLKQ